MDLCDNLPEKLLDRLKELYTKKEFNKIMQTFSAKPTSSFRINTLKQIRIHLKMN
jgi:hypothetical protein